MLYERVGLDLVAYIRDMSLIPETKYTDLYGYLRESQAIARLY